MDRQETCQRGGWKKEGVCSWQASFCVIESCISYDVKRSARVHTYVKM